MASALPPHFLDIRLGFRRRERPDRRDDLKRRRFLAQVGLSILLGIYATHCASAHSPPALCGLEDYVSTGAESLNAGDCSRAEERFRLALALYPKNANAFNGLGMVSLVCDDDLDQAASHFKEAIEMDPDLAEAHNNLGTTLFRRPSPRYAEACDQFAVALEIDPDYEDARENLGTCLMRRAEMADNRGDIAERTRLHKQANAHFLKIAALGYPSYHVRHQLGILALTRGEHHDAEKQLKACLQADPEATQCMYHLACVYMKTDRCRDAIPGFIAAVHDPQLRDMGVAARDNLQRCIVEIRGEHPVAPSRTANGCFASD